MFAASLAAVLAVAAPVPKGPADPEPAEATRAREKAVGWLSKQARDGKWPAGQAAALDGKIAAGVNALAAAALLEAGVHPAAAPLSAALPRLAADQTEYTYTAALRAAALAKADPKKYATKIQADADWLAKTAVRDRGKLVGWSYPFEKASRADGSNTQYALLGLSAAADAGAKVDPKLWREVRELYVQTRMPGGWAYTNMIAGQQPAQTMTAAALCGLYLCDKHLGESEEQAVAALKAGLADWAKRYGAADGKSAFYQWYGTARLGRLAGKKVIPGPDGKGVNWYRDGVAWLAKNQNADGSWGRDGFGQGLVDQDRVIATSFGLLFLGTPRR
jgi:hypothetical protein